MEELFEKLLVELGEDPARPGLRKTPSRVAGAWRDLTSGYAVDTDKLLDNCKFDEGLGGMVICRDVRFVSVCEHHLLPFFGDVSIAYLPGDNIVGISKLVRLTEAFARRLQIQERLGQQIADTIDRVLKPQGTLVHISALHLCMVARGVRQENARLVTLHTSGAFKDDPGLAQTVWAGGK